MTNKDRLIELIWVTRFKIWPGIWICYSYFIVERNFSLLLRWRPSFRFLAAWVLSILIITGNLFTVFLICSRLNLRTKTDSFILSLAVADFFVGLTGAPNVNFRKLSGLSVIPSVFFCDNFCEWPRRWLSWVNFTRWLFSNTSVVNSCVLALDRFIGIVQGHLTSIFRKYLFGRRFQI